jgi:predicted permease
VLRRLLFLFQRHQFDRDLEDELRFHEDMKTHALADAGGMSSDEARAAARRRLGSPLRLREQSRDPWVFATAETVAKDARLALRLLRRAPAFTFTALATLALGIGLTTTIFSVAYGVLWRPLPYLEPDRLVIVAAAQRTETGPRTFWSWAPVSYDSLRQHLDTFDQLAAYSSIDAELIGRGEPLQLRGLDVSPNFFATLGVTPVHGRAFLAGTAAADDDRSVIVSDRLWRTALGADPAIVGQSITIDGTPRTVVGVLPPDFTFRPVIRGGTLPEPDLYMANRWVGDQGTSAFLFLLGRMKPGMTQERVESEVTALVNDSSFVVTGARGMEGALAPNVRTLARTVGLQEHGTESVRTLLLILLGAVSFVLLIACVNVANLQMARLTARRGELSVRLALGAGRRRIVRQLLTEAVVLSLLGAALGVLLARFAIDVMLPLVPEFALPRLGSIVIDGRVLAFCLGLSFVSTLMIGLVPAARVSAAAFAESLALHAGGARTTGDRQGERLRTILVAGQVAMTLVLLIGAGLLIHSFVRLTSVSPGFEARGSDGVIQTLRVTLPPRQYDDPARMHAFEREVLARIQALPGVKSASVINSAPFGRMFIRDEFEIEGLSGTNMDAGRPKVDADYFATMGIPLLAGREFTTSDTTSAPKVAIVSERIVRDYIPGGPRDALGRRVRMGQDGEWLTIVGVVADIRQMGLDSEVQPMLYVPYQQEQETLYLRFVSFVARTATPESVVEGMRAEVRRVAPDLAIAGVRTMEEAVAASVAPPRFRMWLLVLFATAATLIATCGIYGVMSYAVAQRRREIGVRMALGADRREVLGLVLVRALRIVVAGLIVGLVGAMGVTRVLQRFLFGVTPTDPLAFTLVTLLLLAVGLLAAWLPARRATRIDPWAALRTE